ncbi:MAG: hypothetical protein H6712_27360 [Myxococcales bacterium]|nr:hypothetical protein [Myxococcales bacterium]MCB9717597.1 hypothetical protein [Myxococcales bacterium]
MRRPPCRTIAAQAATVPERQALFRQRREPGRRGAVQLVIVILAPLIPAVLAIASLRRFGPTEALVVLAGLLVSTSFVYFGHRFPMHRPWRGLEIVYEMHTRCHHMLFDERHTRIASIDDVDMVLLPWRLAVALSAVLVPLLAAPWLWWLGWDAALAFAAEAWLYYLAYELVHLAAHGRVGGPLDRVPGLGWLLRHHRRHHAWPLMHHGNFSMLIPLWDLVLHTRLAPRRRAGSPRDR